METRVVKFTLSKVRDDEMRVMQWIADLPRNKRGTLDLKRAVVSLICEKLDEKSGGQVEPSSMAIEALEELKEEMDDDLFVDNSGGKSPMERAAEMSF